MTKVLFVLDFYPVAYFESDPEIQEILATLPSDVEIEYTEDLTLQSLSNPMEYISRTEKTGAEWVEPAPEMLEKFADKDVIIVHWSPFNSKMIDAAKNVKFIGSMRSGWENVSKDYAESKGIVVKNCPGRLADSVSDLTMALTLSLNKGLLKRNLMASGGNWLVAYGQEKTFRPLSMLKVGLVGFGIIGQKVAQRFQACGSTVQAYDPFVDDASFAALGVEKVDLDTLCRTSDIISMHARLSDDTRGLIGAAEFAKMQPHCFFINTARAGLADEQALIEALQNKQILGAGLDVYSEEPLDLESPLLQMDNVTLTPHMGGAFPGVIQLSLGLIIDTLKQYLETL